MKLMLVDDHNLFIEGLSYLLKTYGYEITDIAHSGLEALDKARIIKPDIILMDIKMPVLNGIDTLKLIKAELPESRIAMLTSSEDGEDLFDAIRYGASGYLLKNTGAKELVELLHSLENGEAVLTSTIAAKILGEVKQINTSNKISNYSINQSDPVKPEFTERQLEILELVANGITYKEIGTALGLTERTIKYHMGKIIELLHMENRSQVIAYAVKMGIASEPQ